jgi:hypothetical protein
VAAGPAPDGRLYVIDSGNNRVQIVAGLDRKTWHTGKP